MTESAENLVLKNILLDAATKELEEVLSEKEPVVVSHHFERQMRLMLSNPNKWAKKQHRNSAWMRCLQAAAVILLICSVAIGSIMAVSPTARAVIIRWVMEWYETHIIYRYTGEAITGAMPQYEIAELPEGYVEVKNERIEDTNFVSIVYRDSETGKIMYLDYIYMQQGSATDFVTKDVEVESTRVNGMDGQLFLSKDWENERSAVTWFDLNEDLQFTVHAHLDRTDILRVAESVCLVESTK